MEHALATIVREVFSLKKFIKWHLEDMERTPRLKNNSPLILFYRAGRTVREGRM